MPERSNFQLQANVEFVAITELALPEKPIRRHSADKQRKLAQSIAETGYFSPVVLDENKEVLAGVARLEAAKRLGMEKVPAIFVRGLSAAHKKALRIALNRLPEDAKWDAEQLAVDLQQIIDANLDLSLTAFDAIDVDRILTPSTPFLLDDEIIDEPPDDPVSRLGDIWQCGDHILCCGDATDPQVYSRLLWSQKVAMVITDPPYNLEVGKDLSTRGKAKHDNFVMGAGEMTDDEFDAFIREVMEVTKSYSKDGSLHYWFIDWRHVSELARVGKSVFSTLVNICVWAKPNWGMGDFYRSQHEMVVVLKHGKAPNINNVQRGRLGRNRSNLWQYAGGTSFSKTRSADLAMHPTVKPIQMIADAIHDATGPGDHVLDPFAGSGTVLLAAELTKRKAVAIELDPKYVDVALIRFRKHTGVEPVRSDGTTFAAAQRAKLKIAEKVD